MVIMMIITSSVYQTNGIWRGVDVGDLMAALVIMSRDAVTAMYYNVALRYVVRV